MPGKKWKATFEFDGTGKLIGVSDKDGKAIKKAVLPRQLAINGLKTYSIIITDVDSPSEPTCPSGQCLKIIGGIPRCVAC